MPLISSDTLANWLTIGSAFLIGLLVALWLALVIWAYRDMRARTRSAGAPFLVALVVALLPVIGLVIYLLLRPRETLIEAYDRALEQEALLQQIEERPQCPGCARPIRDQWLYCPHCHTNLRRACRVCRAPLELSWDLCPYCGAPATTEAAAP